MSGPIPTDDLCFLTIEDLSNRIRDKEISPIEVAEAVLDRIERHNAQMRAYITVTREVALQQARQAEAEILAGAYRGPLHGLTVSLKDNIATKGIRTSCGSMVNPDWVPDEDATAYTHLRNAGAVLVGKANLREYAIHSISPAFPEPVNPWHSERTPSGSSSGSGVSVASGLAHYSIGTDTGGSGRSPAHVNGVVGVKATYGRVSRWGVVPMSYSLDHITPMTRTVRDGALVLQAVAGHDPCDEYSLTRAAPNFSELLGRDISGLRIGIARGFPYEDVDLEVVNATNTAYDVLRSLGAELTEVRLPYVEHSRYLVAATMDTEGAEVHYKHLRDSWDRFGARARAQLALGNLISGNDYIHAQRVRRAMRDDYQTLLQDFDAIVGPASPTRPGRIGVAATTVVDGKQVDNRELSDGYTNIYNLTGLPALVMPGGFSSEGTPIGLQVAARWLDEATMFQVAYAYEQATDWHGRRPPLPSEDE